MMPDTVFVILGALVACDGHAKAGVVADAAGYSSVSLFIVRGAAVSAGLIATPGGHDATWYITERGKIAYALESGRRVRCVARGINPLPAIGSRVRFIERWRHRVAA